MKNLIILAMAISTFNIFGENIELDNHNIFDENIEVENGPAEFCRTNIESLDELKKAVIKANFVQQYYSNDTYSFNAGIIKKRHIRNLGLYNAAMAGIDGKRAFDRRSQENGEIAHEKASNRASLISYLSNEILDKAVSHHKVDSGYHEIILANGNIFGINLCLPLVANPVFSYDKETREFINLRVIQ